jgi:hypothetical protein
MVSYGIAFCCLYINLKVQLCLLETCTCMVQRQPLLSSLLTFADVISVTGSYATGLLWRLLHPDSVNNNCMAVRNSQYIDKPNSIHKYTWTQFSSLTFPSFVAVALCSGIWQQTSLQTGCHDCTGVTRSYWIRWCALTDVNVMLSWLGITKLNSGISCTVDGMAVNCCHGSLFRN